MVHKIVFLEDKWSTCDNLCWQPSVSEMYICKDTLFFPLVYVKESTSAHISQKEIIEGEIVIWVKITWPFSIFQWTKTCWTNNTFP